MNETEPAEIVAPLIAATPGTVAVVHFFDPPTGIDFHREYPVIAWDASGHPLVVGEMGAELRRMDALRVAEQQPDGTQILAEPTIDGSWITVPGFQFPE